HRARTFGGIYSDGISSRYYRAFVPTVRPNDRDLRYLLRVQCAVTQSGAFGAVAEAQKTESWSAPLVFRSIQSSVRTRNARLCQAIAPGYSKGHSQFCVALCARDRRGFFWIQVTERLFAGRRSGLRFCGAAITGRGFA